MTSGAGGRSSQDLLRALASAVAAEPVEDPVAQRQLLRPVIAELVAQPAGAGLLAEVSEVMRLAGAVLVLDEEDGQPAELVLSRREWLELCCRQRQVPGARPRRAAGPGRRAGPSQPGRQARRGAAP